MYQTLYKEIIDQAKLQNRQKGQGVYYEWHHIVPEFMFKNRRRTGPKGHLDGDPNHPDNLVLLTFQEHLMCHYYLYEIHKDTRYGYQSGAALQFFFTKTGTNHQRQKNLSEVDQDFLNSMAHLRELGIQSISKARKGKMPVVDAVTRESKGSVPVDHPKVLSGEWIHHSKGKPGHKNQTSKKGILNTNYKEMTSERKSRVMDCITRAIVDEKYISMSKFTAAVKTEFSEFRKISQVWITNNFGSIKNVVEQYNTLNDTSIIYDPYYRSKETRSKASRVNQTWSWVTDGYSTLRVKTTELSSYLSLNPQFQQGRSQ